MDVRHVTKHGRAYGAVYHLTDGRSVYLAHRKRKDVFHMKNAWTIDISTLEMCRSQGIEVVGVLVATKAAKFVWMTPLDDFFKSPHSFAHFGDTKQRGLPLTRFAVNPGTSRRLIEKAVKIR